MKKFIALISFVSITQAFAAQQPLILENQQESCKAEITMDDSDNAQLVVTNTSTGETMLSAHANDGWNSIRPVDPPAINEFTGYQVHSKFAHKRDIYFASWDGGLAFPYPQFYIVVSKKQDGFIVSAKGGLQPNAIHCDKMVVAQ